MRTSILAASALLSAAVFAFACGGGDTPPPATPSTPSAPEAGAPAVTPPTAGAADAGAPATDKPATPPPAAADVKFDALPKDKKVEIMMGKVVPNVGKLFKEHDGKKFASFGCGTCHGPKKNEDPHKVLPKLNDKVRKAKPEMVKFMTEKVTPEMGAALGEKDFGCKGCHTVE